MLDIRAITFAIMVSASTSAWAQQQPMQRAEVLVRLSACRVIADAEERLRCFDREAAAFDEAERKRDIVVVDRAGVRAARRSLFGLTLPSFRLFGNDDEADRREPEFNEINTTIKRVDRGGSGMIFVLADGARWLETEPSSYSSEPRAGAKIRIRRAALGSFLANVDGQRAVRVRRIN